jgi:hypothetical protein
MKVLFWGLSLSVGAFLIHLIVWRVHLPRRQTKVLLSIFAGVLIGVPLCFFAAGQFLAGLEPLMPSGVSDWLRIVLFHVSVTLAYMITYSAIEADSPSLVMVMAIAKAGAEGMDAREFDATLNDDLLIKPRVEDLITDRMAYVEEGRYRLTGKGVLFANIFVHYRRLLKAPKGG